MNELPTAERIQEVIAYFLRLHRNDLEMAKQKTFFQFVSTCYFDMKGLAEAIGYTIPKGYKVRFDKGMWYLGKDYTQWNLEIVNGVSTWVLPE